MLVSALALALTAVPAGAIQDGSAPTTSISAPVTPDDAGSIGECGDPPKNSAETQARARQFGEGASELIQFGRELVPEDGARCSGMQYFNLVLIYTAYALFGRTVDEARIGAVLLRYREKALVEDPTEANRVAVAGAKLQLAQTHMKLGEIEAFRDVLSDMLARSPSGPKDVQYRTNLANLAHVAMMMGEYATARDLARRGLSLLKSELGPAGYYPDETPAQVEVAANCTTVTKQATLAQRDAIPPAGQPIPDAKMTELNAIQAELESCVPVLFSGMSRGLARSNHGKNLRLLAESSLALGDDAEGEAALRRLITVPKDYEETSGLAELDLGKLARRKGRAEWQGLIETARKKAKRDLGIRDPLASWTGQTLPFEQVVGDRDKAGLTSHVLQRAGETELLLGRPAVALTFFKGAEPATANALLKAGLASPRLHYLSGLALLADGRAAEALPYLEHASREFDAFTPTSRDARSMAMSRNEGAVDVHLALLEAALAAGDGDVIDRALLRAGRSQLSRTLANTVLRDGNGDALDAARLATQADQALMNAVIRGAPERELQTLAQTAAARHQSAAVKAAEVSQLQPQLQLFGLGPISTTAAIRGQLPEGSAILIYAVGGDRGYAALLTRDTLQIERLQLDRADIAAAVGRLRASTEFRVTARGAATRIFAQRDSDLLYRTLIAPFAPRLTGLSRLYISRTAPLDGLPFAALRNPANGKWLVDQAALSLILDPSGLGKVSAPASKTRPSVLAIGDPRVTAQSLFRDLTIDGVKPFTPARPKPAVAAAGQTLPGALGELTAVISAAGGRSVLLSGAQATEARFRTEAVKPFDIIAIASHAVTESVTYKAPRPAIVFTPGPGRAASNDGLLHPDEIEGLAIKAHTIILSACETAGGNGQPGAEALSGLAQAFLYSGPRTILATQWKVESLSAASLMSETAVTLSSTPDVAHRLRRSMRALRARKGYSHPAYWAPFVVVERTIS